MMMWFDMYQRLLEIILVECDPHHDINSHDKTCLSFEPEHDKTNKMTCAPIEDSDQPVHPNSLIRVCADAQADMSLLSAHSSSWFCHASKGQIVCRNDL